MTSALSLPSAPAPQPPAAPGGLASATTAATTAATATAATPAAQAPAALARHRRWLQGALALWLAVGTLGQALFGAYVLRLYGGSVFDGDLSRWNKVMPHGHVPGDLVGNGVLGLHLLFTLAVLLGGSLQLLPALRRQAPRLHRWVGRGYIASAVVMALGGLLLVWTRGAPGRLGQHLGISLNALLILLFAALALRAARAGHTDAHRRWALRLYLSVLGVWFFRLGLTLWLAIHRAPVGFDPKTFSGPFLTALAFAQSLLPLALLQALLWAQRHRHPAVPAVASATLALLALATAAGSATAYLILWHRFL